MSPDGLIGALRRRFATRTHDVHLRLSAVAAPRALAHGGTVFGLACQVCGRTLLAGERPAEMARDDHRLLAVCPSCAIIVSKVGYRLAAADEARGELVPG